MGKSIYRRKDDWILCYCTKCGRTNYVEPHGTTAKCQCSNEWTEHKNIPYGYRLGNIQEYCTLNRIPREVMEAEEERERRYNEERNQKILEERAAYKRSDEYKAELRRKAEDKREMEAIMAEVGLTPTDNLRMWLGI